MSRALNPALTLHRRDQIRAALVDTEVSAPANIGEILDATGINVAYYADVAGYLRTLERKGMVERYEVDGDRRVYWGATSSLRALFQVRLPPMRVVRRPNRPRKSGH